MGLFEKRRMKQFLTWVQEYKDDQEATHQGQSFKSQPQD
jgi:Rab GDP dissociation inhibitor